MGRQARRTVRRPLIPRVSFILPIHNVEETLAETLDSLTAQTFTDFDVLMHDDGSTDGTAAIALQLAENDRRFRLVGQRRVGLVEALCSSIRASDAEFLARIDGDDIARPDRLEKQLALLSSTDITACGALVRSFSVGGTLGPGMKRYTDWLNEQVTAEQIDRAVFIESPLCHPSVTMRRDAYECSVGYTDDGHPEDYHLWLDFHARGFKMCKVPEVLLDWRDLSGRLTRTDPRYGPEKFLNLKRDYLLKTHLAPGEAAIIWGAGKQGRRLSRALSDAGVEITRFIDIDPAKIGRTVHGKPVSPIPASPQDIQGNLLLLAVGAHNARRLIEAHLLSIGCRPDRFVAVA